MEEHLLQRGLERSRCREVLVVAEGLARQCHVQAVVQIVGPLRLQAVSAAFARRDQLRVVEVGLGDQAERAADPGGERVHLDGQLLEHVHRATVRQRVHGVEPEPVDVEVPQPLQGVVDHVPADLVGVRPVQVQAGTPVVATGEVRAELVEVRAGRPEVVVDHVEQHGEASRVAGVDEPLEAVRAAVGLVHSAPQDTVVTPALDAVEAVDRHDLDERDAEIHQVVELLDRRVERAGLGERADVQLVDHSARQRPARPALVGPLEGVPVDARRLVHAARLPQRPRIRIRLALDDERVVRARRRFDVRVPPVAVALHLVVGPVDAHVHRLGRRRPDREAHSSP